MALLFGPFGSLESFNKITTKRMQILHLNIYFLGQIGAMERSTKRISFSENELGSNKDPIQSCRHI